MYSVREHLENLVRHIRLVQEAALIMGQRLIESGRHEFGKNLIARGFEHDVSKFYGVEWDYLHVGPDVPSDKLSEAVKQHVESNDHHPEYWGGIDHMPEIAVAEMVCDWYARSQEFGTSLRQWVETHATKKFGITKESAVSGQINTFVDMLLRDNFKRT